MTLSTFRLTHRSLSFERVARKIKQGNSGLYPYNDNIHTTRPANNISEIVQKQEMYDSSCNGECSLRADS